MPSRSAVDPRPLWSFTELADASGGVVEGSPASAVEGISIDTRSLRPGDVFVALTDQRDGHEFVSAAFGAGAVAAIVAKSYRRQPADGVLVRVDDPLTALRALAAAARARLAPDARVVAVTGSAGKTGTTAMLRACLATQGATHAPEKSFNNHWGVPLTLARMPAATRFAVIEIGMSNAGEISPLARLVRPHVAVVTNVLPVHVGNFADGEIGVANAKAEIFEGLEGMPGTAVSPRGLAIILRESPHYERLRAKTEAHGARVVTFGSHSAADCRLESPGDAGSTASEGQVVTVSLPSGRKMSFDLGIPGAHIAVNAAAVACALDALGVDLPQALGALASLQAQAGRGQRLTLRAGGEQILLIDESYNANPASMRAALDALAGISEASRRIAIVGDMLELGPQSAAYHRALLPEASRADLVFACGPNMQLLFDELPSINRGGWASNSTDLLPAVVASLRSGDVVMVKGSLGSRMAPIVEAIKKRFAAALASG
jgi:UDP-N-acetylmuramoyl-tripeptide--D-alanyl-D-alanine ligase